VVYSKYTGWHAFSSSKLDENDNHYEGLYIAPEGSSHEGKLVEKAPDGKEYRPIDLSLTKNALALLINGTLLVLIILYVARWYKRHAYDSEAPKGFVGIMEMLINSIENDVIKASIGENYKKFSPYLLTAFFFIFFNNLMGLIPIFPGGAEP